MTIWRGEGGGGDATTDSEINFITSLTNSITADTALTSANAAATAALYDSFDDRYLGSKAAAPTLDNDGNVLIEGALYWNSVSYQMFVWSGVAWQQTFFSGTNVRSVVTATAGQTVVTVPTYTLSTNTIQVYVNGFKVISGTDYAETNTTSITFASGLTLGDEVEILIAQPFSIGTTSAEAVSYIPSGTLSSLTAQTAIDELASEKVQSTVLASTGGAALVGNTPSGTIAATTVQGAINEIVSDLASSNGSSLVGYLPSGTGAVAATAQSKLRESVSPKDFGAAGDGTTNDTAAFALLVASLQDGSVVDLLGKSYVVQSNAIVLTSKKRITFNGGGAKILRPSVDASAYWAMTFTGCVDCVVDGVEFDRSNSTHTGGYYKSGIYAQDCSNFVVRNCRFPDVYYGVYVLRSPYSQFLNNYCRGIADYSVGGDAAQTINNIMFYIADAAADTYSTSSHHSVCSNNVFCRVRGGVYNNGASYLTVENNVCDTTYDSALYSIGEGNVFVGNNIYNAGKDGIKVISTGSKSVISCNYIKGAGVIASDGGAYISTIGAGHSISGNVIEMFDPDIVPAKFPVGIVYKGSNVSISGNTIIGAGNLDTAGVTVIGIVCSTSGASISNASISGNNLSRLNWGIYIVSSSTYTIDTLSITGNVFKDCNTMAIALGGFSVAVGQLTYFNISSNIINGIGDGIRVYNASNGLIFGNDMKGPNTTYGVRGMENGDKINCWHNILDTFLVGLSFGASFTAIGTHVTIGTATTLKSITNEVPV